MGSLMDRIKGVETVPENGDEISPEIPHTVPDGWSGLAPDPEPVSRKSAESFVPKTYGRVTPALKKRIAAELQAYIEFAAMPIVMRDPVCGGAIHEQAKPIAAAITAITDPDPEVPHTILTT